MALFTERTNSYQGWGGELAGGEELAAGGEELAATSWLLWFIVEKPL